MLKSIDHPNIPKLFDVFVNQRAKTEDVFMIRETVTGQVITGIQLQELAILDVASQLLECLEYLHSKSIAHCQIEYHNVYASIRPD